jgi:hypothetical protein
MLNAHFYMPPAQIAVDVMSCANTSQEVLDFVLATFPEYVVAPVPGAAREHGVHLQPDPGGD